MRFFCLLLISLCTWTKLWAQHPIDWAVLQDVRFEYQQNAELDAYLLSPVFGQKVKAYAGKEVQISGFVIPLDVEAKQYVLSGVTMNACFFCGQAGPESVMELEMKEVPRVFNTDEFLCFKGILILNEQDVSRLTYILRQAELVGPGER